MLSKMVNFNATDGVCVKSASLSKVQQTIMKVSDGTRTCLVDFQRATISVS